MKKSFSGLLFSQTAGKMLLLLVSVFLFKDTVAAGGLVQDVLLPGLDFALQGGAVLAVAHPEAVLVLRRFPGLAHQGLRGGFRRGHGGPWMLP